MHIKLIILFALAGCLSVASQDSSTTTSSNSDDSSTTSSPTTIPNSDDSSTTSSPTTTPPNSNDSSTTSSPTTTPNSTTSTTQRPPKHPKPHRPHPRPPPPQGHHGIPRIPIISDLLNAIHGFAHAIIPHPHPHPPHHGGPGPRRPPRAISLGFTFNASNILGLFDGQSLPGFPGIPDISQFELPNIDELVPDIPDVQNSSDIDIGEIPNLPRPPPIPGLQTALNVAREILADAINTDEDLVTGIHHAIDDGLNSFNPTESIRGLVSAILNSYLIVARNCPVMIIGGYVLREGLYLASSILLIIADISAQVDGV